MLQPHTLRHIPTAYATAPRPMLQPPPYATASRLRYIPMPDRCHIPTSYATAPHCYSPTSHATAPRRHLFEHVCEALYCLWGVQQQLDRVLPVSNGGQVGQGAQEPQFEQLAALGR